MFRSPMPVVPNTEHPWSTTWMASRLRTLISEKPRTGSLFWLATRLGQGVTLRDASSEVRYEAVGIIEDPCTA
jgi:hypothetical protein